MNDTGLAEPPSPIESASPPPTTRPLLSAAALHKTYRLGRVDVPVLKAADLDVRQGEWVAVLGVSGSGKSTLLHLLGDLDQPDSPRQGAAAEGGEVYFRARPLSTMSAGQRNRYRNRAIGFVFQFYHLLPELSVLENTLLPELVRASLRPLRHWVLVLGIGAAAGVAVGAALSLLPAIDPTGWWLPLGLAGAAGGAIVAAFFWMEILSGLERFGARYRERRARATALLESFGLGHRLRHRPRELSGGERQRVAIARALVNDPDVLLADEPTGNLDEVTGAEILELIAEQHRNGLTIVMVTHDPAIAKRADRVVRLHDGRIVE